MHLNLIREVLQKQNWQYSQIKGKNIFHFGVTSKNGNLQCISDLIENEKIFVFYSICGTNTSEDKRIQMLYLLNELNYRIDFGNFEMDSVDGEIRFRMSIPYSHLDLTPNFIENILLSNISIMDKCLPSLLALMFEDISIDDALLLLNQ